MIEELSYDHTVIVILAVLENVRDEFSYRCTDCKFRREFLIEESVQPVPGLFSSSNLVV